MNSLICLTLASMLIVMVASYGYAPNYNFGYHVRHGNGYGGYAEVDRQQNPHLSTYKVEQTHPHGGYSRVYSSVGTGYRPSGYASTHVKTHTVRHGGYNAPRRQYETQHHSTHYRQGRGY